MGIPIRIIAGVAAGLLAATGSAQLVDPIPTPITKQGLRVELADVVPFPDTTGTLGAKPDHAPFSAARINFFREAPDGRLFVNDLRGQLYRLDAGLNPQVYLDIDADNGGAGSVFPASWYRNGLAAGLISFEFHPEFATNGLFYTLHTERAADTAATPDFAPTDLGDPPSGVTYHTVLTEWDAADPLADAWHEATGSRRELLRVGTTASAYFHPFGDVRFNPTASPGDADYGLLYVSGGDWGYINGVGAPQDPNTEGQPGQLQRLDSLAGSLIRIDPRSPAQTGGTAGLGDYTIPGDNPFVDGDASTLDEIYAFGFRNGHRLAWDADGTAFVNNIGHNHIEEVERLVAGGNYGWGFREGSFINGNDLANGGNGDADDVFAHTITDAQDVDFRGEEYLYPVLEYDDDEGRAIAGGFVYQGVLIPELYGKYVFGDIVNGRIFAADAAAMKAVDITEPGGGAAIEEIQLFTVDGLGAETDVDLQGDVLPGRVDLRFGMDGGGEIWLLTKTDGYLRRLATSFDHVWANDGGGDWDTGGNWEAGSAPGAGGTVVFGPALTSAGGFASVQLDTAASASHVAFGNNQAYELVGGGTLTLVGDARVTVTRGSHAIGVALAGSDGLVKDGGGTLSLLNVTSTYTGQTRVEAGTLALVGTAGLTGTSDVRVLADAVFDLSAASGDVAGDVVVEAGRLRLGGAGASVGGGLDVQSGAAVAAAITFPPGHAGLAVTGPTTLAGTLEIQNASPLPLDHGDTITLLTAAGGVTGAFDAVTGDQAIGGYVPFVVEVQANAVVLRVALDGDANADGAVDTTDLAVLAGGWQLVGGLWSQADFNNDGLVNAFDLDLMRLNWSGAPGSFAEAVSATAFVPEPGTLGITALAMAGAMMRRRRRS